MAVLDALTKQNSPLTWIDTHAGRGLYDLQATEAQKLAEYKTGILPLLNDLSLGTPARQKKPPPLVLDYEKLIKSFNQGKNIRYYPGSSLITAKMLRPKDRLYACDLHPQESKHLIKSLKKYPNVTAQKIDGLQKLHKILQQKPKAGGALIDPSYEIKTEYETIASTAITAHKSWPQGIIMIWYPMLKAGLHENLKSLCGPAKPIIDEWIWGEPGKTKGLYGSGMIIFNAPKDCVTAIKAAKDYI